ncbi:MAG: PQQ-binding-like beta-propeller repeat protein [Armatimonadetes bacterium]|nr:PQQ-binding-like beta-propeller repeat protein [Armatimonadota bacterium]
MLTRSLPAAPVGQSPRTPAVRWEADTGGPIEWRPVHDADSVYVSNPEAVTALNTGDGSLRWKAEIGEALPDVPVPVPNGPVLVQSRGNRGETWHALDPTDGHELWSVKAHDLATNPWIDPAGRVYVLSRAEAGAPWRFSCRDPWTGAEKWSIAEREPEYQWYQPPVYIDGTLFIGAASEGKYRLSALDPDTGQARWSFDEGRWVIAPQLGPDHELIAVSEKLDDEDRPYAAVAHAFDACTGEHKWQRILHESSDQSSAKIIHAMISDLVVAPDGTVLISGPVTEGEKSGLLALDSATGEVRWQVVTDEYPLELKLAENGDVYYSTFSSQSDGYHLYRLDPHTGQPRWTHEEPQGPGWLPQVLQAPAGSLYVEQATRLTHLDPETGKVRWQSAPFPASIALATIPGAVLLGSWTDNRLGLVAADTGEPRWVYSAGPDFGLDPSIGDTILVSTGAAGHVIAMDTD